MGGGGCLHRHCRHFSGRRALSALSRQGKRRFSYISLSLEWFVTFEFFICSIWRRRTRILCSRLCRRLRRVGIWYLSLSVSGFSDEDVSDLMVGLVQSWCFWGSFPCCWLCSRTWSPNFVCQSMSWVTCCLASFRKKSMPLRVSRTGHLGGICSPLHHHLAAMRSPTLHTFYFILLFVIHYSSSSDMDSGKKFNWWKGVGNGMALWVFKSSSKSQPDTFPIPFHYKICRSWDMGFGSFKGMIYFPPKPHCSKQAKEFIHDPKGF